MTIANDIIFLSLRNSGVNSQRAKNTDARWA